MRLTLILLLLLVVGPAVFAADAKDDAPATILIEGRIWTADSRRPWAEAVAVRDEKIVAVGSREDLQKYRGDKTHVIDAGDGLVVPGLIDSHIHLIDGGLRLAVGAAPRRELDAKNLSAASASLQRRWSQARGSTAAIGTTRCGAASCRRAIGSMP